VKLDGATRVWIVSCSVAAVCIFLTGALRASSILGPGTLFGAFTISIAILLFFAIKLATARPRLNLTLAAETIVAIGIFSLIISIAVVLFSVSGFMIEISQRDLTITDMRRFAWPFGEGLAAAAIAPFIATLLRHIESNLASVDSGDAGTRAETPKNRPLSQRRVVRKSLLIMETVFPAERSARPKV
jgi:hypothetical protein